MGFCNRKKTLSAKKLCSRWLTNAPTHKHFADNKMKKWKMTYLTSAGTPQINATAESYSEYVLRRPIHQIQIKIILQFGRVQHFEGDTWYFSGGFSRRPQ